MSTKLEAMVGYLAGRDGDPRLLDELTDPSSEASRFLEATRTRSKALLAGPDHLDEPRAGRSRPRGWLSFAGWALAGALAVGVAAWVVEARLRRIESTMVRREVEARAGAERIEAALARLAGPRPSPDNQPDPAGAALGRVEAGLGRLERTLEGLAVEPEPPKLDPTLAEVRNELATLRRELSAGEKAAVRRAEELLASNHEVARLLRLLLDRSQPSAPAQELPPFPNPRPTNGRRSP
jgi:hypothetical protein